MVICIRLLSCRGGVYPRPVKASCEKPATSSQQQMTIKNIEMKN
jgi:hypothetical protein